MSLLLALARSPFGRHLVHGVFRYMTFALPVARLRETATLVAFHHPRPAYPVHILLVPKKPLSGLADLGAGEGAFLADLFETVRSLVAEFDLDRRGYRLIANGGAYQAVAHLHFHLITETAARPPA
jgi:histidine triad (HIT) family protein